MADSCKLHSPASARPRRGTARRGAAIRLKWNTPMVLVRERKAMEGAGGGKQQEEEE